jgi:hypothetical protein
MPVIPFSSAARVTEIDRETQEQRDIEEARRYREKSDAKLKELMEQKVKPFDPNGGTSPIDVPDPVTGGWRVRTNGDPQPNADALPGGVFNRLGAPDINDPMRDEQGFGGPDNWTPELAMPAAPEGESFVGMGSGGPEQPVGDGGLSEDQIANIRDRFRARKEGESTRDLRARMLSAPNPDQAAMDADLAERQGVNRLEVERNRDTFVAVDRAQAIDELRKTAPKLRAWLDYNPANLEVAHDDVQNLGWWEQTQAFFSPGNLSPEKVGKSLEVGFGSQLQETLWGLDRMLGESNAAIYKALPDWVPGKFDLANEQVQRSLTADMNATAWGKIKAGEMPQGVTWLERGIYGAAASSPSTVIALATTVVTKNPYIGAGLMGATTAGGAYQEAREAGKSYWESVRHALTQGGIEAGTEFLPAKFLLKDLATDAPFLKTFTRNAVNEGMGEQVATFTGDLDRWLTLNPEGTIAEFFAERPNAALETLVASTIMSGVTTTVAKGMQAAGDQLDQNAKQKRAEDLAKFIDKAVDNGTNSKLLKRGTVGADKYREAVAASTDAKFRIDSDAITALAQEEGVTVEQIAQAFRIDPDEMVTAIDTGSDVLVPVGNYVAAIQTAKKEIGLDGGAIHTALGPNMRVGENDLTAREQASMASVMEAEQKARTEGGDAEQSFADAADRVRNTIREAVTATGLFNADAANTQAELVGSIVTTLAERTGQDPEALWKEQGFDIVASLKGEQPEGDSLPQSVGEDATPTQRLIDMRAKGMGNAEIAAELYPDVDAKTATNRVKALASKHKAKIEERRAALEGAKSLAQGEQLEQTQRGTFTPREDRNVIRLFESANLSTLAHEGSHWYLDTLWRMSKTENPHPFVLEQLAAVLEWHGKSPNWDAMFNPDGSFTKEGVDLQEAFAETFEVYLREGNAPTTALRSVFASFKQWLLNLYKSIEGVWFQRDLKTGKYTSRANLDRAKIDDEIRNVFKRMLASDEAINAVHTGLARDGEAMAKAIIAKQDPEGKWKPERKEKFMARMRERYAAARERADAALTARLIDEYMQIKQAENSEEKRQVRREAQAEVDARPEQRLYAWFTGKGWRETAEDRIANEAATEADAMRALAQAEELGYFEANATDASIQALQAKMVENGIIPIVLLFRTSTGRVIAFPGDSGNFGMHHDMAREVFGLGDLKMQHGVWNPRKWPTIEAMNAADTAWYDTTGTAADTIEAAPAQPRVMRGEAALAQGGEGLLVYRGSGDTELGAGRLGTGLYLAEDPEIGAEWGGEAGTVDAYRITGKLFDLTEETAQGLENYARRENTPAAEALFARLKAEGYVGVRDPWSGHINVFDAKDMVRTPQSDTELGKTWTNYALEMGEDGAGSLAQTVQPSRQLEDGPAAFGLTPEQAKKVNPIYNPKTLPVERLPSNQDAALWLEGNYIGDPVTDLTAELSDEQIKEIATIMAAEAQLALGNTGNAFTWYSSALAKALDIISIKYPMLADDAAAAEAGFGTSRNARFAFTYIMAVTSQNLDVAANSVATDKAFADMLKRVRNGDFTMPRSWGTGDKQKAMGENFAKFGPLIDKMPGDDFPSKLAALDDLFRVKMTVKEWVAYMKQEGVPYNKPGQTAMDAVVYGSSLLGPKIGNGFWQNLNGNYDPMTIDLWMRRTWGRLTGKSIGNPAALPEQRARLAGAIKRSRSREQGKPDHIAAMAAKIAATEKELDGLKQADFASKKEFTAEEKRLKAEIKDNQEALADLANLKAPETWSAEYNTSNDALLAYAKRLLKAWNVEYERLKEASNSGTVPAEAQPTWARAAKTIVTNLAKPLDQVANGTQRKQIERAGKEALQILKARGIALTTADLQAILWYPEKELWGSLTAELETDEDGDPVVPPSSLNESYDTAFSRILKEQGYEVQGTSGDGSSGPGAGAVARQDAGPQGAQGAGGSGASGGAAAGRRSDAAGPQSLAQSQTHDPKGERELDALGFYSAVFEAAKSVRPDVWSMGWDHARNSIVKGGAKINGQRVAPRETEMAFLGLDAMFYGTKLKGAELAEAVLDHIQAKRLSLVENFARFDPNVKAPTKAEILDEIDDDTLGFMMGVAEFSMGFEEGRIVASELDGADEFHTGLFVHLNKQEVSDDPVKRYDMPRRTYNLYRGLNLPGQRELIATDVIGNLLGKAARIILNENRNLVMRKISAANMRDYWEQSRTTEAAGLARGPGDIRLPGEDVPLFEAVIGLPEGVPGSDYRAPGSHIGGKAKGTLVTAHGEERIDDKGQRTVFVGQVQSDMAQQARADKEYPFVIVKKDKTETPWRYATELEAGQAIRNMGEGGRDLSVARAAAMDTPLLSTSEWTNVAVRSMLYRAAREGFQSISFPTAETSEIIQGNDSAAMHYETNVKGALEKLAKQLGGEMRLGSVAYADEGESEYKVAYDKFNRRYYLVTEAGREKLETFKTKQAAQDFLDQLTGEQDASSYILDITPAMRAKIMSEGFPLFQTGDDKGRATPPPNLPPMRLNLQAVKEQYGEQALAEIPPDVAAYSAEANDVEAYVQIARDVRKTLNETPPKSLWKFLSTARNIGQGEGRISYRGIRDTDGELLKIIGEKKAARGLIADPTKDSKRSRSYDMQQAIEAAWEAGYFDGEDLPTPAQFLDTLRADIDGQAPRYRRDDIPTVSTIAGAERWKDWFDQNDMDITSDVATLRAKLATVLTGQGTSAIGPDEAAEVFNGVIGTNAFPTGFDLLKALKQGPLRDKLIRDLTEQRMIERNGDVFRDGTIMQEAEAYARNEVQHRQFEIELEALAEAAGKGTAGALAKQTAIENLRSKQVREVLNYTQWLTLERRWAEKAIKAAAKGDTAQAAEFARYRLINSYMYSEGKKLAEKIEKTRKHLLDYGKKAKQVRLFAAGKEYAEQMNGLLDDYQFRNESKKGENKRKARSAWIQTQMAGIDPFAAYADPTKSAQEQQIAAAEAIERSTVLARLSDGVDAQNYKSITVEELLAVRDEADLIYKLATLKDRLIKDGERRKLSLAAEDIAAEIEANQPNDKGPEPLETDTPGEKVKSSIQMYFAMHRTLQSLAHQFAGGKDGGVFWRYIVRPLNEAFGNLTTIRKQMGEDVAGLFGVYTTAEQERFYRDRRQFAGIGRSLTTQGRLAIALNWGNEKNRRRIMDAYGWDEAQVQEVLDSLDKRDWDWVQSVWDYMDTWFPEANRVHEAVHGAPMDKVEPIQVATRFGVYRGGYYPIKYDPRTSSKSGQRAMEADAKRQTGGIGTRSQPGFGKKRVEGKVTLPLRLSALDVITQHLDEVAKSIATEETLFDIGRILKQPAVEEAIISRHGRQIYNQVVNQIITAKFGMDGTSGLLAHLRNGATVVGLSWKVATASLQILGASNSIVRVGGPWVAAGYAKTAGGGVPLYTAARDAMRKSEFMRNRRQNQSPEMASLLDAMKTKWTPDFIARFIPRELRAMHNFMVRNGFALMSNVQFASVDVPTWWGAYFKAQSTGASEEDAVAMADQAVVDAQGGGEIYQLAAMQSGAGVKYGALLRILTNFMSYMITTYNLGVQRVRNARTAGQIMALGFDMIILAAVPVAGKMALDLITKGVGEDDEPEEWAEKYAREQIAFLFGPFVGISQFAGSARGDDSYGYKGPAGLMFFDVMNQLGSAVAEGKIIDEEEGGLDKNFWRPANRALGIVLHYPASQVDASIRGAQAYFNGETDNPAAIFFGPPPAN